MAYLPWWLRMSPPTFAERFDLGGLAKKSLGFSKGTPQFWLDLLNRYTYDQHPLENKENIMTMVDTAIENKKDEWTNIQNQLNSEIIAEKDIVWDEYIDINNVNSI